MSQLFNIILTLGVPALGLLIAYRVWTYATKSGNKSPMQVASSMISIVLVFAAGVLFIPRALNWGSNIFVSQMMQNPGVQAGIGLAGTGAGLIDSGLSGMVQQGQAPVIPQVDIPQIQLPTFDAPQPQSYTAPNSLTQPFSEFAQQFNQSAPQSGSQVVLPAPAAGSGNLVQQVQVQAQATAQALTAEVQQAVNQAQAPQTDAQALNNFSFDTYLATPAPAADCLTGAQQGPQLPHCVDVDRTGAANRVWEQQQANIQAWEKESATEALNNFSWGDTANAAATAEANIAQAAANATVQAQNAYVVAEATRQAQAAAQAQAAQRAAAQATAQAAQAAANAEHQRQWVAAQAQATRQAYEASLRITQPSQAEVHQAAVNPTPVPAGCLTGAQQGPQLPHCVNVDRDAGNGSVWSLAESGK